MPGLVASGTETITVNANIDFSNAGDNFTQASSTILMAGAATPATINAAGENGFHHLTVAKSLSTDVVQLLTNLALDNATGVLTLTTGNLQLNGFSLTLGSDFSLNSANATLAVGTGTLTWVADFPRQAAWQVWVRRYGGYGQVAVEIDGQAVEGEHELAGGAGGAAGPLCRRALGHRSRPPGDDRQPGAAGRVLRTLQDARAVPRGRVHSRGGWLTQAQRLRVLPPLRCRDGGEDAPHRSGRRDRAACPRRLTPPAPPA